MIIDFHFPKMLQEKYLMGEVRSSIEPPLRVWVNLIHTVLLYWYFCAEESYSTCADYVVMAVNGGSIQTGVWITHWIISCCTGVEIKLAGGTKGVLIRETQNIFSRKGVIRIIEPSSWPAQWQYSINALHRKTVWEHLSVMALLHTGCISSLCGVFQHSVSCFFFWASLSLKTRK